MNRQLTERLNQRLDAIEARRPAEPMTIIHVIVEPDGTRTGERWQMLPGGAVRIADAEI